jgi:hypothetical protein
MADEKLARLSAELVTSRFSCVPRGDHDLQAVYSAVKSAYPELCDDSYLCSQHCAKGQKTPEWRHKVRSALSRVKAADTGVTAGDRRGEWRFS